MLLAKHGHIYANVPFAVCGGTFLAFERISMVFLICAVIAAAAMVYLAYVLEKRRKKYMNGIHKFAEKNRRFDGVVTSIAKGSVMLKFRDEEQKKTIHHRYLFSKKRYKPDCSVVIFYDEENDTVCVEGDNPFIYGAIRCAVLSAVCAASAVGMVVLGIVSIF